MVLKNLSAPDKCSPAFFRCYHLGSRVSQYVVPPFGVPFRGPQLGEHLMTWAGLGVLTVFYVTTYFFFGWWDLVGRFGVGFMS